MRSKIYKEDQGTDFGKWDDPISRFLYMDSTYEILRKIDIPETGVIDFGGGNGLMKNHISHITTIDKDPEKNPDIVDDILEHWGEYNLIIIRYVLHYLNDYEVLKLMENVRKISKQTLIIQFTNDLDLKVKYENSQNEFKYFRTTDQLEALMGDPVKHIYCHNYIVKSDFYKNRLGIDGAKQHMEQLNAYLI